MNDAVQEDTMCVLGRDGKRYHLFRTHAEEDAAVAQSPLKVVQDLLALGLQVGRSLGPRIEEPRG